MEVFIVLRLSEFVLCLAIFGLFVFLVIQANVLPINEAIVPSSFDLFRFILTSTLVRRPAKQVNGFLRRRGSESVMLLSLCRLLRFVDSSRLLVTQATWWLLEHIIESLARRLMDGLRHQ